MHGAFNERLVKEVLTILTGLYGFDNEFRRSAHTDLCYAMEIKSFRRW